VPQVRIRAETDKSTYVIGETATAVMTVENQDTDLESAGLRASLIRYIVMRDDFHATFVVSDIVSTADLPHPAPIHHPTPVTE